MQEKTAQRGRYQRDADFITAKQTLHFMKCRLIHLKLKLPQQFLFHFPFLLLIRAAD